MTLQRKIMGERFDTLHSELKSLWEEKNKEYAEDGDSFASIDASAKRAGVSRESTMLILFEKHLSSISKYIRNGKLTSTETVQSRIKDAIVYLYMLYVSIDEKEQKSGKVDN
jgi:hypothetical protein